MLNIINTKKIRGVDSESSTGNKGVDSVITKLDMFSVGVKAAVDVVGKSKVPTCVSLLRVFLVTGVGVVGVAGAKYLKKLKTSKLKLYVEFLHFLPGHQCCWTPH